MEKLFGIPEQRLLDTSKRDKLYISHTSGVDTNEASAIFSGVEKLIQEVRSSIQIVNYGNQHIDTPDGRYADPDWYQDQAKMNRRRNLGQQVDASRLLTLLSEEVWQHPPYDPHMDVMVIDSDMTSKDTNYVYGAARYPNYAMSVRRFRERIEDVHLRLFSLAVTAAHELGHNFGLIDRNFNRTKKLGLHCNGESGSCLMEQVDVAGSRSMEDQARILANQTQWLCTDCAEEATIRGDIFRENNFSW